MKSFLGFTQCPICKEITRHYTHDRTYKHYRRIFCEKCQVLRIQHSNDDIQWYNNGTYKEEEKEVIHTYRKSLFRR